MLYGGQKERGDLSPVALWVSKGGARRCFMGAEGEVI